MYTRRKRRHENERQAAASRAAAVVQHLWRRKDPLHCKVVRRPFWIFRGDSAFCFDANVLYDYVATESDCADLFTRQPYSRAELFALAFIARRPHLTRERVVARRVDIDVRRQTAMALEAELAEVLQRMAEAFPYHEDNLSRKLVETMGDIVMLGNLQDANLCLTHAIERNRKMFEDDQFQHFSTEMRTMCFMALLCNQI